MTFEMVDERGRGLRLHPSVEYVCTQRLMAAILEKAIEDRFFLDGLGKEEMITGGSHVISTKELDSFAESEWREFLTSNLEVCSVDVVRARNRGQERASLYSARNKKCLHKKAYFVPHNGEQKTLIEWASECNLPLSVVIANWNRKGSKGDPDWLNNVLKCYLPYKGKRLRISSIAEEEGLTQPELSYQMSKFGDIYKAVEAAKKLRERKAEIAKMKKESKR